VAPVSLPESLERPQLVRRTGATTVSIEEFDRWVEPLDTLLRNALALDLTALLPDAQVLGASAPGLEAQQTVVVAVDRLDVAQEVSLDAVWFVLAAARTAADDAPRPVHRGSRVGATEDVAAALAGRGASVTDIAAELTASRPAVAAPRDAEVMWGPEPPTSRRACAVAVMRCWIPRPDQASTRRRLQRDV
jgi:uncharacterized lipoprotein YmbA